MRARLDFLTPLLAVMATWVAAWTWVPFAAEPSQFLAPLAVSGLVVAVPGAVLRALGLPWPTVTLCQAVLLLGWVNFHLADELSRWGWFPTRASLEHVGQVLQRGVDIAQNQPSPVPAEMVDFAAFPFVVATACMLLAELIACGLRLPPLAGLPMLAMYTAPVSQLSDGVPVHKFLIGALVFLAMLWAAEIARQPARTTPAPRTLGASLGATLMIGLPAALVATMAAALMPTLSQVDFGGGGGGSGSGSTVRLSNPTLNLKRDLVRGIDVPLVFALTDAPSASYLRTSVLDEFDEGTWKPGTRQLPSSQRADGEFPTPAGLDLDQISTEVSQWHLATSPRLRTTWLPLPFPAAAAVVEGDWRYDASTMDVVQFDRDEGGRLWSWQANGLHPQVTASALAAATPAPSDIATRYATTDGIPDWLAELAEEVTTEAETDFGRALLLQRWFTQPHTNADRDPDFSYSLDTAADGTSLEAITDFLLVSRVGYCEQFAGAMAMMARSLGIPARIAVGFLGPTRMTETQQQRYFNSDLVDNDDLRGWMYTSHDLHAWPELYFEGAGWVRFEPTPSSRSGTVEPSYTIGVSLDDSTPAAPAVPEPTASTAPAPDLPVEEPISPEDPTDVTLSEAEGSLWPRIRWSVAGIALLIAAFAPRAARGWVRRQRWRRATTAAAAAEIAWWELRDGLRDAGSTFDQDTTVRRAAAQVAERLKDPGDEAALARIVAAVEHARYAGPIPSGSSFDQSFDTHQFRTDVDRCVAAAGASRLHTPWPIRLFRAWLPGSLRQAVGWRVGLEDQPQPELAGAGTR